MKINRAALIFGGIIAAAILLIAGGIWFYSLFTAPASPAGVKPNFFSSLFPFGQSAPGTQTNTGGGDAGGPTGPAPSLREVSHAPVAGAHFQNNGTLRFMEKETGHVYETRPESLATTRISNTTIPGIQRVVWLGDSAFILQYLDGVGGIRNYFATLASSTPDQALIGRFLSNFTDALPSFDEKHMTVGVRSASGIAVLTSDTEEKTKKTLFVSPLRSWTIIPNGERLFIESAPSEQVGFLYQINTEDLSLKKILGNIQGLMALPHPSGAYIAYSSTNPSGASLFIFDTKKNTATASPIATLAEKCAWFPAETPLLICGVPSSLAGASPDAWFMGVQSFSDSVWIIDPVRGTGQIIRDLAKEAGRPIDVINPSVSPNGAYLVFTNKNDLSLWTVSLAQ
jgi:hypothetical protein